MSKTSTIALLLNSAVILTAAAQSQPLPSGAPPFRRGVLGIGVDPLPVPQITLIQKSAVQDELKLSKAQRERIAALDRESREKVDRLMQEYRTNLPPPDQVDPQTRQAMQQQQKMAALRTTLRNQSETAIINVLQRRQRARLDQVQLQAEGPFAFTRPEVFVKLSLSPAQLEAIQEIVTRGRQDMVSTSAVPLGVQPGDGPLTPGRNRALSESKQFKAEAKKSREATLRARDATMRAIAKVLTTGQRTTYRRMLGEPFDLTRLRGDGGAPANVAPSEDQRSPSIERRGVD